MAARIETKRLNMASEYSIAILANDAAGSGGGATEHGLALWVETSETRLLFDTGAGTALFVNAERLGVALDTADAIAISHGHDDHTGGLARVLELNRTARVYLHPEALRPRYSRRADGRLHSIGMPGAARQALETMPDRVRWTAGPATVGPGLFVTGAILRRDPEVPADDRLFADAGGRQPDLLPDDQALWMETPAGIVAVLGCAHAGLAPALRRIAELSGRRRFRAVLGGFHLGRATDERCASVAEAVSEFDVREFIPLHCTGERFIAHLFRKWPDRVARRGAGDRWRPI